MSAEPPITPIDLVLDTAASPADAWTAITDPIEIARWFTDASPLGEPGAAYRLDFGGGSVVLGVVTDLVPGARFAHTWAWADGDGDEDGATLVTWTVDPLADGGARIHLVHDGWGDAGGATARDDHEGYWAGYLEDLRHLLGGS